MLVTEKPGRLRVVSADGTLSAPVAGVPKVDAARPGRPARPGARPDLRDQPAGLLELHASRRGGRNNTAVARGRVRRRRGGAAARERAGDLPPDADAARRRCTSAAVSSSRATAPCSSRMGERSITRGPHAGAEDGQPARQDRPHQQRRLASRRTTRSSARPGVRPEIWSFGHRNVQAAALHPTTGELWESRARHARRRRGQHRAQGQGLRLADDRLRHRVPGPTDHRRRAGQGGHGAADLLLGPDHRARAA